MLSQYSNWYSRSLTVESGLAVPDTHLNDAKRFLTYLGYRPGPIRGSHAKWTHEETGNTAGLIVNNKKIPGAEFLRTVKEALCTADEFREWLRTDKIQRIEDERNKAQKPSLILNRPQSQSPSMPNLSPEKRNEIKQWLSLGFTVQDVANHMGMPENFVAYYASSKSACSTGQCRLSFSL